MRWEPWSALGSAAVLIGIVIWQYLSHHQAMKPIQPGCNEPDLVELAAVLPPLRPYLEFYTNEENPFVPYSERVPEKIRREQPPDKPTFKPAAKAVPPTVIPTPKLVLPTKSVGGGDAPKVIGIMGQAGEKASAYVQLPGERGPRWMMIGDTVGTWTLLAIEAGNVATFADPTGRKYTIINGAGK